MEPKVREVVGANPILGNMISQEKSPTKVAEYLETAYKLAKYESGQVASDQATQALSEFNRQNKQAAQTMSGTNSQQEDSDYFEMVKKATTGIPSFGPR